MMKFYDRTLSDGQRVLLVVLDEPVTLDELATLTNGYTGDDIGGYNGSFGQHDAPVTGTWAIPAAWLNAGGKIYLANATPAGAGQGALTVPISGAGGKAQNLTPLQIGLIIGAAVLAIVAISK